MIAEMIPVFSRKPIFGYEAVAASTVAIVVLSSLVWGHHMLPSAWVGPWICSHYHVHADRYPDRRQSFELERNHGRGAYPVGVPCSFVSLSYSITCAGLTWYYHASAALDWQTKNSYFLVAHFHFVFVGAIVFAMLGALPYWFPKMSGRMMSESLANGHSGYGSSLQHDSVIQHVAWSLRHARRIFTYPDIPGWGG